MKITFWGVRGSIATPGPQTAQFGGNTTCVEVRAGGKLIIFDAGSGIRPLGNTLLKEMPLEAHLFFSHMHHDHNQGFPFFVPAFVPGNKIRIYGADREGSSLERDLGGVMSQPYFPVSMAEMKATFSFTELAEGQVVDLGGGVTVDNRRLNHPGGVLGFRVNEAAEGRVKSFTFCTDTEHYSATDRKALELAQGTDVLAYDAQYTEEEYPKREGWGHSVWNEGVKLALEAGVKRLVLTHHDPSRDDRQLLDIEAKARARFPEALAARDGLTLDI